MRKLSVLSLLVLAGLLGSFVVAQETKGISWKHGLGFQVRKPGENAFTPDTTRYGAEVFLDKDLDKAVYIAETASLGVGTANKLGDGSDVKPPLLSHGLEVRVRPVGEASFDKDPKRFSLEVFRDVNSDNLVYICNSGWLAVTPANEHKAPDKVKDPAWSHGLELKVRKAGDKEFDDKTQKVSLEVYKDENTNLLLYVSDSGQIAVVPAGAVTKPTEVKSPLWFHAFEAKVRAAKEEKFSKDTKAFGVEVYKDENANTLIYVTEKGGIAVVPAGNVAKPTGSKEPTWQLGRAFRVRKAKEADFNDQTQRHGAEVYKDENTGNLVYLTESGAIAVVPK